MSDNFIKQVISKLREDLEVKPAEDFVGELFEKRAEDIHTVVGQNSGYKEHSKKITEIEKEISKKFDNPMEIIEIIERRDGITYDRICLSEKLMYKQGLLDGLVLITEGIKQS